MKVRKDSKKLTHNRGTLRHLASRHGTTGSGSGSGHTAALVAYVSIAYTFNLK